MSPEFYFKLGSPTPRTHGLCPMSLVLRNATRSHTESRRIMAKIPKDNVAVQFIRDCCEPSEIPTRLWLSVFSSDFPTAIRKSQLH